MKSGPIISKEVPVTFYPANRQQWRSWLQENHEVVHSAWIGFYKKQSGKPTVSWSDAVDEALCFGWIDSTRRSIDNDRFLQFFCRRKPTSVWSKINKDKVARLLADRLIAPAGLHSIAIAQQNGSWTSLDAVEKLLIPDDLAKAFKSQPSAKAFFESLSKSVKKSILQWIVLAKRPETRNKRIAEMVVLAGERKKPRQF